MGVVVVVLDVEVVRSSTWGIDVGVDLAAPTWPGRGGVVVVMVRWAVDAGPSRRVWVVSAPARKMGGPSEDGGG